MAKYNRDALSEAIENLDRSDFANLWNDYCDDCGASSDKIYPMADACEIIDLPSGIVECIETVQECFKNFNPSDDFFCEYSDGTFESTDDPMSEAEWDEMVDAIMEERFTPDITLLDLEDFEIRELRPFKTIDEFKDNVGMGVGAVIIMRPKDSTESQRFEGLITELNTVPDEPFVCIGKTAYKFDELFSHFEYKANGEWQEFGVKNEPKQDEE